MKLNLDDLFLFDAPIVLAMVGAVLFMRFNRKQSWTQSLFPMLLPIVLMTMGPFITWATVVSKTFAGERRSLIGMALALYVPAAFLFWRASRRPDRRLVGYTGPFIVLLLALNLAPGLMILLNGLGGGSERQAVGRVTDVRESYEVLSIAMLEIEGIGRVTNVDRKPWVVGDEVLVRWTKGLLGSRRLVALERAPTVAPPTAPGG